MINTDIGVKWMGVKFVTLNLPLIKNVFLDTWSLEAKIGGLFRKRKNLIHLWKCVTFQCEGNGGYQYSKRGFVEGKSGLLRLCNLKCLHRSKVQLGCVQNFTETRHLWGQKKWCPHHLAIIKDNEGYWNFSIF